jgi:hypothetical protein
MNPDTDENMVNSTSEVEMVLLKGVETFLSFTALNDLYYFVVQIQELDIDSAYNRKERG